MTRCRQSVQPIKRGQEVLIVIGEHLDRTRIAAYLNADKHSPASSARSTKRRVRGDAYVSGS